MTKPTPAVLPRRGYPTRYLPAIVDGEARRIRDAVPGNRNNALNLAGFLLGQLVGAGELTDKDAHAVLEEAAGRHVGIHGFTEEELQRTITSGLRAGVRKPRAIRSGVTQPRPEADA